MKKSETNGRSRLQAARLRWTLPLACLPFVLAGLSATAQGNSSPGWTDYSKPASIFPNVFKPYELAHIPEPSLVNARNVPFTVQEDRLQLTLPQLITAVVENNLDIADARWNPHIAETELMRARSGQAPRGVDQAVFPNDVFAGSVGSSTLGTSTGSSSGSSNPGGITGTAGAVSISPSGRLDPSLSFTFSHDQTESPLNTEVVSGLPFVKTATYAGSVSYVQAFTSGTSFTLSYGVQSQTSSQLHLLFNPAITPGFTATVSQQLLNGFGFAVNRAVIKVAENEEQIEREAFRLQVTTTLVSAEDAYWDLVASQEAVLAAQQALTAAQQLESDTRREVQVGTLAPLDVVTAQSQVASSQRDLIVAQTNLQQAQVQMKHMFTTKLEEPLASASVEAVDPFPDPEVAEIPDLDKATQLAEQNRPELHIAQGNMKSLQDVRPFLNNELLPTVNAFALVTNAGLYDVFGSAFTEAIQFKYPEIAFGLTISFPFRNNQAQADEVRSRLELQQDKAALVQSTSNVDVGVQNAIIALQQAKAQVRAAAEATALAQESLDEEQKKLDTGVSTAYNVVLQQRALFAARLAETQARGDTYAKARVGLDQAEGTTLQRANIPLDDALIGRVNSVSAP